MFEKLLHSKVNAVADWIIRLVMVNIMIIFFSLGIITIYPAFSAGYSLFSDYVTRKDTKLIPDYFKYFKQNFGKKVLLQLFVTVILLIGYSNIRYYTVNLELESDWFLLVGYYVTLALLGVTYAVVLYSFVVMKVTPNLKLSRIIKISFYLAGKYYFITLLLVVCNLAPFLLLLNMNTFLIFVFMGISIPLTLHALLTRSAVQFLDGLGKEHD